jgi:group I intron endonuclease
MNSICKRYGVVYIIRNTVNGKIYVGQTTSTINIRFRDHCCAKPKNGSKIANAIRKYGKNAFVISEFLSCFSKDGLDACEDLLIKEFDSIKNGYNCKTGGSHGKHSAETKAILGLKSKASGHWEKALEAARESMRKRQEANIAPQKRGPSCRKGVPNMKLRGRAVSTETRAKIGAAQKGKTISPEQRAKISDALRGKNYLTDDGRARISVANTGRTHSVEIKKRLSEQKIGSKNPMFGKPLSPKAFEKLSRPIIRSDGVTFVSVSDASRKMNCSPGMICHVLHGRAKHFRHFTFSYLPKQNRSSE